MTDDTRITLIGCGNMGGAMLRGWLAEGVAPSVVSVVDPLAASGGLELPTGVTAVAGPKELSEPAAADVVVVAVKPQILDRVLPSLPLLNGSGTVFVSVVAGKTIGAFESTLEDAAIVRAMPNTPAAIGHGMTVLCASALVSAEQRGIAERLMGAVGATAWVDEESLIDAVTAVSGSGPAYVFLLIEAMTDAGVAVGLSPELSTRLALETVAGAGALASLSDDSAAELRRKVTSPEGTTQAALEVLDADDALRPLVRRAIEAAHRRARELAGG